MTMGFARTSLLGAGMILLCGLSGAAQTSGVSTPPAAIIEATPDAGPQTPQTSATLIQRQKPSAAVSAAPAAAAGHSAPPMVDYNAAAAATHAAPVDPDAEIVTSVGGPEAAPDDSGIVTSVSAPPNTVPAGTLLKTRIRESLSTAETLVGTRFTAEVVEPMQRDGRVVIPAGSIVTGRVTEVRGGRRIKGAAALHLTPQSVTLPDGTYYMIHAQVFDTTQYQATKVDDEGTILRKDHVGETMAAMSLTTGGAAATGAIVGGPVGALVGAGVGAGASTVWWLKQDRQEVIPAHTGITFGLMAPLAVTPTTVGTR